jgi:hypothetical protein
MSRDDREEEPERRSLSCRMWSTSDRKTHPRGGNARMWSTSDQGGGTLRMWSTTKPKPTLSRREQEQAERKWRYAVEDGKNPRTDGWAPTWKPAPLPGTPKEARERQKKTRFRPGLGDTRARKAARRGGKVTWSQAKSEAARLNGRKGGRPRKRPVPDPTVP